MSGTRSTVDRVKDVLRHSLKLDGGAPFADDMPLVGGEYDLDSLDILLIITNIEREFEVKIREGTINREAFKSIRTLSDCVDQLKRGP